MRGIHHIPNSIKHDLPGFLKIQQPETEKSCYGYDRHYQFYLSTPKGKIEVGNAIINIYNKEKILMWEKFDPFGRKNPYEQCGIGTRGHNLILSDLEREIEDIEYFELVHLFNSHTDTSKRRRNHLARIGINMDLREMFLDKRYQTIFGEPFETYKEKSVAYEAKCKRKQKIILAAQKFKKRN